MLIDLATEFEQAMDALKCTWQSAFARALHTQEKQTQKEKNSTKVIQSCWSQRHLAVCLRVAQFTTNYSTTRITFH